MNPTNTFAELSNNLLGLKCLDPLSTDSNPFQYLFNNLNYLKCFEIYGAKNTGLRIRIHFIRIRIQHFRMNTNPDLDPDPIRIQGFNDQKLEKKITAEKKN
jgi:hypothetical protein